MVRGSGRASGLGVEPPVRDLESVRDDWQALAAGAGNPFGTWEWAAAWWQERAAQGELHLRRVRDADGRLMALLPLYRVKRGPLTVLRFLGHDVGDQLGPVCAPVLLPRAVRALAAVAAELPVTGLLLAERLPGEAGVPAAVGAPVARHESSPVLDLEGRTWEQWLQGRSSNFRQQVRRRERRLERDHGLRYRMTADAAQLDADMTTLVQLHGQRWKAGDSEAFTPARERFHRRFARHALERGWLRLWIAEAGERPVAAWYGLRFDGREWYYQAGRDPSWDDRAVGFVLLAHTIRAAFQDGMREYRFGLGDEPYKTRFASADPGLDTLLFARIRPASGLATASAQAAQRLPPRMRGALLRRAG